MANLEATFRSATSCPLAFDNLTRQLYATDASLYQLVPVGVAFPKSAKEAASIFRAASEGNVGITPRGAGTGLVGGAIGQGIIVDFARHNRAIGKLDLERRTVQVGAGVVLDQLNTFLKPHGLQFGPDVATSSRATIGGMIANNSSGSHTPVYGTTAGHVESLEVVTVDGRIAQIGPTNADLTQEQKEVASLIAGAATQIQARMPAGLLKRWPGYAVDRWLRRPGNLCDVLAGSEGTLAGIMSAELKLVPLPKERGVGLLFFASLTEAMEASVSLLDLHAAAVEHVDRSLLDQTRGQMEFQAARDLLRLDEQPCESILIVEFFDGARDKLAELARRPLGSRKLILQSAAEAALVWNMRKAGLSLLTSRKGTAKPVTGVEDAAVRPEQLPEYVASLKKIMDRLGLEASFYGHAAAGLLHVRPVLDLHLPGDLRKLRTVSEEVSAVVRQFQGSLSAEHGVGMARTEFMREHLGDELLGLFRGIKHTFDPRGVLNPGKLFPDGRYQVDSHLRLSDDCKLALPFEPVLAFAAKDESFVANLEQCNGCGGCLKAAPTMCPTFVVTGEEIMSTRGRANAIRAVLTGRAGEGNELCARELEIALSNCLSCKACATECPSNVNLPLLKAELLHARQQQHGLNWRERLVSNADWLGRIGCLAPEIANQAIAWRWVRSALESIVGFSAQRPLPRYAQQRFDKWFETHRRSIGARGKVILWDDTFVRYHEPEIGRAAVRLLEAAGFEVLLPRNRRCCGRPAFSQGRLDQAKALGKHNLALLVEMEPTVPILFLEPSCFSMFVEDYRELRLQLADAVRSRCWLFEEFIEHLLERVPNAFNFTNRSETVVIHAHCHTKALRNVGFLSALANRVPGRKAMVLPTGCCGMAGAFGMSAEKQELSAKVAGPMLAHLASVPADAVVIASGTSCRQQIEQLSPRRPLHTAEWLASALA